MSNRERREHRVAGRYHPPRALEYNEFVGEFRPPNDRAFTELHVRYGVRDDRYLDWSITLNERLGDIEELRAGTAPLQRRTLEVVDVSDSAIRRHVFDPNRRSQPPHVTRLVELRAGDHHRVNYEYQNQMNGVCMSFQQKHPEIVEVEDRHNTATAGFMAKDRDVQFREGDFGWVRNTVTSIDTDLAEMVFVDRAYYYFPTSPSTAAVLLPDGEMKFIIAGPGTKPTLDEAEDDPEDGPMKARGDVTMGMLVQSIYAGDWTNDVDDLLN
ncbi:hypothetical protein [Mycobacterium sp. URHB0021]